MDSNKENTMNEGIKPVMEGANEGMEKSCRALDSCTTKQGQEQQEEEQLCMVVGGAPNGASLQDSFKKFMTQKKKERQLMKLARNGEFDGTGGRTEAAKEALRSKFIEGAKKYLGVPYAERFKDPDVPVAPLYLDCCGLIRQVVIDLQEDFGFIMGRWNQAYQMDTLPIVLNESQLKPGDLIFYEGLYNSKRSKAQKHNNVHVEIFLGGETGEATIGSRYHRGNVSIFPSYKFKSTTWDLVQYHFRSLDTWLNGECKSHCPEHPWHSDLLGLHAAAGKRSIFHESDDESAGGGDVDDDDGLEGGFGEEGEVGHQYNPAEMEVEAETKTTTVEAVNQEMMGENVPTTTTSETITTEANGTDAEASSTASAEETSASHPSEAIPSASPQRNNLPRPSRSLSQRQGLASGTGTDLTNILSPSKKNTSVNGATKTNNQLTSSSTVRSQSADRLRDNNNNDKTAGDDMTLGVTGKSTTTGSSPSKGAPVSKRGGVARAGLLAASVTNPAGVSVSTDTGIASRDKALTKKGSDKEKDKDGPPPLTYYVGKGNGWRLVKESMDKRGWQQLPFEYSFSSRFGLKWVERRSQIDYRAHTPGQLVNHIPNNDCITTKAALLSTIREKYCRVAPTSTTRLTTPWLPETYQLDSPSDIAAIFEMENQMMLKKQTATGSGLAEGGAGGSSTSWGCLWIYKPSCNNRGRGIRVIRGKEALELVCYGKNTGDPETSVPPSPGILQRYIENPLLAGEEGCKFDVRCYLLVARNEPSYVAYYHPGYCRLSLKKYSADEESLDDPTVHLTNASVQKKDPLYETNKEMQIQTIENVAHNIELQGQGLAPEDNHYQTSANFLRNGMDYEIKQCMVDVLKAAVPKLTRKKGYFDLFGFDFMVSTDNQLLLLEVNTNPALSLDNEVLTNLLPGVVDGTVELVLRAQGPPGGLPQPSLASKSTPGTTITTDGDNGIATAGSSSSGSNDEPSSHVHSVDLTKPPGRFQLLFDEETGFEYKSDKRLAAEARKEEKKTAATAAAAAVVATPAVAASN